MHTNGHTYGRTKHSVEVSSPARLKCIAVTEVNDIHYHNLSFQALEMLHGQDKTNKGKKQSFKNNVLLRNSRISNISP